MTGRPDNKTREDFFKSLQGNRPILHDAEHGDYYIDEYGVIRVINSKAPLNLDPNIFQTVEDRIKEFVIAGYYFTNNDATQSADHITTPGTIVYPVFGNLNFDAFTRNLQVNWDTAYSERDGTYKNYNYYNPRRAARIKQYTGRFDPLTSYEYTIYKVPQDRKSHMIYPPPKATDKDFDQPITGDLKTALSNAGGQAVDIASQNLDAAYKELGLKGPLKSFSDLWEEYKYTFELIGITAGSIGVSYVTLLLSESPKLAIISGAGAFLLLLLSVGGFEVFEKIKQELNKKN